VSFLGRLTRRSQLGRSYERHREEALRLAQEEMDGGAPRQEICDLLMLRGQAAQARRAYADVAERLQSVMLERNAKAAGLERQGDVRHAVELYEANIADRFAGAQPYERLLEIYVQRGDWLNAARVGEAYLKALDRLPEGAARRTAVESSVSVFRQRARGAKA